MKSSTIYRQLAERGRTIQELATELGVSPQAISARANKYAESNELPSVRKARESRREQEGTEQRETHEALVAETTPSVIAEWPFFRSVHGIAERLAADEALVKEIADQEGLVGYDPWYVEQQIDLDPLRAVYRRMVKKAKGGAVTVDQVVEELQRLNDNGKPVIVISRPLTSHPGLYRALRAAKTKHREMVQESGGEPGRSKKEGEGWGVEPLADAEIQSAIEAYLDWTWSDKNISEASETGYAKWRSNVARPSAPTPMTVKAAMPFPNRIAQAVADRGKELGTGKVFKAWQKQSG